MYRYCRCIDSVYSAYSEWDFNGFLMDFTRFVMMCVKLYIIDNIELFCVYFACIFYAILEILDNVGSIERNGSYWWGFGSSMVVACYRAYLCVL